MLSTGKKSESRQPIVKTAPSIPTVAASSSSSNAPPLLLSPPWTELPDDLTANILQRLDAQERLESAQLVCSTWWRACKNPAMWRVIDFSIPRCQYSEFQNVLRCAIDRSQGQLVELKITGTAYDWPHYISERYNSSICSTCFFCSTFYGGVDLLLSKFICGDLFIASVFYLLQYIM